MQVGRGGRDAEEGLWFCIEEEQGFGFQCDGTFVMSYVCIWAGSFRYMRRKHCLDTP